MQVLTVHIDRMPMTVWTSGITPMLVYLLLWLRLCAMHYGSPIYISRVRWIFEFVISMEAFTSVVGRICALCETDAETWGGNSWSQVMGLMSIFLLGADGTRTQHLYQPHHHYTMICLRMFVSLCLCSLSETFNDTVYE